MGTAIGRYTQVKISAPPELASAFKAACAASGISMSAALSKFMAEFSGISKQEAEYSQPDLSTRRKRRRVLKDIVMLLEQIRDAEERLIDNAPDNLRDAPIYETAGQYVEVLDEVAGLLGEMVP